MVSFEIFVKSMLPSLSELKVLPSFCFAFKIPDDVAVTNKYQQQMQAQQQRQAQQQMQIHVCFFIAYPCVQQ